MLQSTASGPHSGPTQSTWIKYESLCYHLFGNPQIPLMKHYFVPAEDIDLEDLAYKLRFFIRASLMRRGCHENLRTRQIQQGFFVMTCQKLIAGIVEYLKKPLSMLEFYYSIDDKKPPRPNVPSLANPENNFWAIPGIQPYEESKKQKDQFEFLKTLWGLLDAIIELMETVRIYVALILNTVFSSFSEFPNSIRPPCTTMPWTIWPALVVLWGVCWMFIAPLNAADELQLQLPLEGAESTLFSNSDILFNPSETPLWTNQDISNYLSLEDSNLLNSLEWSNDVGFNQISHSGESSGAPGTFPEQLAPPLPDRQFPTNLASANDFLGTGTSLGQYPITTSGGENSTASLHNQNSAVGLTIRANTQAGQITPSSQASTTSTRPEQPLQNSNGEMTCDHLDCSSKNLIFTKFGEWSKHKNKHERPYRCTIESCTRVQGFAAKGDQIRHEQTVHKALHNEVGTQSSASTGTLYFCDEPNCKRGPENQNSGFTRKDYLRNHVKRRHGRSLAPSRVSIRGEEGANGATVLNHQGPTEHSLEQQQINVGMTAPGRQKRTASQASDTFAGETNVWKKPRQEDQDPNANGEKAPREEALAQEVKELRKALEKKQKENEVLISIIDRLTQGPK